MERIYFQFFMRFAQFFGLGGISAGLENIKPLAAAIAQAVAGNVDMPALCGKLVAITAPSIAGILWIWLLEYFIGEERRLRLGSQAFPNEPWMTNPMWARKHIRLSNRRIVIAFSMALVLYVTLALPHAVSTQSQSLHFVVGAAGLIMLRLAHLFWLKRKWQQAELRLGTLPGIVGGPFTGVVILQEKFPPETSFEVSLKCMRGEQRGDSAVLSIDHTEGTVNWSSVLYINKTLAAPRPGTTAIPVSFAVPFECPSTTLKTPVGASTIRWKLSVNLKNSFDGGHCVFEVPVFKTAESRRNYRFDEEQISAFYEGIDSQAVAIRTRLRRRQLADGTERWEFSMFSLGALLFFIGMVIISALGLSAAVMLLRPWPISIFVGFFSAVFVSIGVHGLIETVVWASSIVSGPDVLTVKAGIRGFRRSVITPRDQRTRLECQLDFRKGNGEWWCIYLQPPHRVVKTVDGVVVTRYVTRTEDADELDTIPTPRLKLVKRLNGRVEAEAFRSQLAEQLGITRI